MLSILFPKIMHWKCDIRSVVHRSRLGEHGLQQHVYHCEEGTTFNLASNSLRWHHISIKAFKLSKTGLAQASHKYIIKDPHTVLYEVNPPVCDGFPRKGPVMPKTFSYHGVVMAPIDCVNTSCQTIISSHLTALPLILISYNVYHFMNGGKFAVNYHYILF